MRSLVVLGLLVISGRAGGDLKVQLNLKENQVVGDVFLLKVDPQSDTGILKVEVSVDDQLRATLTKPPYEFSWDTIDEPEGAHTVAVGVFDTAGMAVARRIRVEVENELSRGPVAHAAMALERLRKGDTDAASLSARKASRADAFHLDSIRATAAVAGAKGEYARAIDLLEKPPMMNNQPVGDPKRFPLTDSVSLELRGLFRIQRSALAENPKAAASDLSMAYDLGKLLHETILGEVRANPNAGRFALGDALFDLGEREKALDAYRNAGSGREASHRVAFALIHLNREHEAEQVLRKLADAGQRNDTTVALEGLIQARNRQSGRALQTVDAPSRNGSPLALLVKAHLEIEKRDFRLGAEAMRQAGQKGELTDLQVPLAYLLADGKDEKGATRALYECLRRYANQLEFHVLRAYLWLAYPGKDGYDRAAALFDFVLARDPANVDALLGRALVFLQKRRPADADLLLRNLLRLDREKPDVWMAQGILQLQMNQQVLATEAQNTAKALDAIRFGDRILPRPEDLMIRVARYRRPIALTTEIMVISDGP